MTKDELNFDNIKLNSYENFNECYRLFTKISTSDIKKSIMLVKFLKKLRQYSENDFTEEPNHKELVKCIESTIEQYISKPEDIDELIFQLFLYNKFNNYEDEDLKEIKISIVSIF